MAFLAPRVLKTAALLVTGMTAAVLASLAAATGDPADSTALMALVAIAALLAVLGQPLTRQAPLSIAMTLLVLGLSLGALAFGPPLADLFRCGILIATALLLLRSAPKPAEALIRGAVAGLGIGILALAASAVVSGDVAPLVRLVACAVLLPLFPLQSAFVGSLRRLPGTLPAFMAVVLPCLGWQSLVSLMPELSPSWLHTIMALALLGALYETVRASVQLHLSRMLASITTVLFSLVWWHAGATGQAAPEAGWYVSTVSLAASGLLVAAHRLETQYGFLELDKLRGLARPMPRFAAVFGLLLTAVMGLPLFGVFSSFMAMLFSLTAAAPGSAVAVPVIWLAASLLSMKLLQRLLWDEPRPELAARRDFTLTELLPLILVLALLALSVPGPAHPPLTAAQAHVSAGMEAIP